MKNTIVLFMHIGLVIFGVIRLVIVGGIMSKALWFICIAIWGLCAILEIPISFRQWGVHMGRCYKKFGKGRTII